MSTYLDQKGWGGGHGLSDSKRDKYFSKEKTDFAEEAFKLKDGYEARYLGSGDSYNNLGALETFTNSYDDGHEDFEESERKNFGIFKIQDSSPSQQESSTDTPEAPVAEAPAPPKKTPTTSAQASKAQSLVNSYKSAIMKGESAYNAAPDIAEASPTETPGESFLKSKKLELGSGLQLS